jgi:hypothetical protein
MVHHELRDLPYQLVKEESELECQLASYSAEDEKVSLFLCLIK